MEQTENKFNPLQRDLLLSELEKVNDKINTEKKLDRKMKNDTPKYKCHEQPLNSLRLHLLEERKVMIQNLLKANDWVYIEQYNPVTKTYEDYIKKDIGYDENKKENYESEY